MEDKDRPLANQEVESEPIPDAGESPAKKSGSGKLRKSLSWLLIIGGLILLVSPWIGRAYNAYLDKQLLNSFEDEIVLEVEAPQEEVLVELADLEADEEKPSGPAYQATIIGSINIPKLNLVRPIANGITRNDLKVAIGKIPGSANIGEAGNLNLAGHRNYAYKVFFDKLDQLEIGDDVILTSNKGTFTYRVYERMVVETTDVWVLSGDKTKYTCTLITCHPRITNEKRLIYKAELIDPLPETKEPETLPGDPKDEGDTPDQGEPLDNQQPEDATDAPTDTTDAPDSPSDTTDAISGDELF